MLTKPKKYDEIIVNENYEKLEVGGHKGVIVKIEEYTSDISGNTSLKVAVDTTKDDKQPNHFKKMYDENTNKDKKWPSSGIKYVSLKEEENCVKMLKGFITSVENSNKNFKYDWNKEVDQLKGKNVGLVFGLEEYRDESGTKKVATKIRNFRSLENVELVQVPKVKLLDGTYMDYDDYEELEEEKAETGLTNDFSNSIEFEDDSLAF